MSNDLGQAIENYSHMLNESAKEDVKNALWQAIYDAIKGQKTARCFGHIFDLKYSRDRENVLRPFPDTVECFGIEKGFSEAFLELYNTFLEKIENLDPDTVIALSGDETARIAHIKGGLAFALNNKVFNDEINAYKRDKRYVEKIIKRVFNAAKFDTIPALEDFIQQRLSKDVSNILNDYQRADIALWALSYTPFSSKDAINWVKSNLNQTVDLNQFDNAKRKIDEKLMPFLIKEFCQKNTDIPFIEGSGDEEYEYSHNPVEEEIANEFVMSYYSDPTDSPDVIKWQEEAFFWVPGQDVRGVQLEKDRAVKAMYIAFFYAWLRNCSYATFTQIGKETEVYTSSVTRWSQSPHEKLREPFPFSFYFKENGIYPVYFSYISRNAIGMYNPKIRCYQKNNYQGEDYDLIKRIKGILWDVYSLLRDIDTLDYLETCYDENAEEIFQDKGIYFSYEIKANEDIEEHANGQPYSIVYIKSVERYNGEDSN